MKVITVTVVYQGQEAPVQMEAGPHANLVMAFVTYCDQRDINYLLAPGWDHASINGGDTISTTAPANTPVADGDRIEYLK